MPDDHRISTFVFPFILLTEFKSFLSCPCLLTSTYSGIYSLTMRSRKQKCWFLTTQHFFYFIMWLSLKPLGFPFNLAQLMRAPTFYSASYTATNILSLCKNIATKASCAHQTSQFTIFFKKLYRTFLKIEFSPKYLAYP